LNWRHLIDAARILAGASIAQQRQGRPRQAMLKRAISTAYYAMFHALCSSNANSIAGLSTDAQTRESWTRTYRSLDHGPARDRMARDRGLMEPTVQQFATAFALLQQQRRLADYDPHSRYSRRQVINLIGVAEAATEGLMSTAPTMRRPLATLVLLRER
jgi:hypothetical protein